MLSFIGWLGSLCFALCAAPQAYQCYKQKHASGVNSAFIWLWFIGEICMIIYTPMTLGWDWPIMTNYIVNIIFICIILRYIYFPKQKNEKGVNI